MLQQGFDYAYDKRVYDRLRAGQARPVREPLHAGLDYQRNLARFLETHDEPRAAATFSPGIHEAAAVITYLSPGLRFFHQGQFDGRKKRVSPHVVRAPREPINNTLRRSYDDILPAVPPPPWSGCRRRPLDRRPAFGGPPTSPCALARCWSPSHRPRARHA